DMPKHVREKYLHAKKVIESMGGQFSYTAIPYEGAKVTLKLPFPYEIIKPIINKAILSFQAKLRNRKE
ncbi:MAG: hypothetical protein NC935_08750, partial [Candidatus Omnitrophica bacterium]|nr:hypothetical protein [Candidatus Omnitrophota bacterium]